MLSNVPGTPEQPGLVAVHSHLENKRENLRLALQTLSADPGSAVSNKPLLLHLEITSRCNLRCLKCGHATDPPGSARIAPRHLPYRIIETFDEYFAAAVRVHTFGYGEMFLYGKLRRLVERLKYYGCSVDGITNGVLVGKDEVDWLVEYGYDELTFSIDGVKASTMQRLRGVDVERIWDSLEYLQRRKQEVGAVRPRLVVNFVAQADNYDELPDLVRKLSGLGVYFFGVNPLMPAEPHGDPNDPYNKLYREFGLENVPREKLEAVLNETRELAYAAGMGYCAYIDLDSLYAARYGSGLGDRLLQIMPVEGLEKVQQQQKLQPYYCSLPWTSMYVHANTGSRVCCFMDGSLGTVEDAADLHKAWTQGVITEVREAISKGEVHPSCRSCVQLGRYQHSHTELEDMKRHLAVEG